MKERNILGKKLEICSLNPLTGYNRDGKCSLDKFDHGNHLVSVSYTHLTLPTIVGV